MASFTCCLFTIVAAARGLTISLKLAAMQLGITTRSYRFTLHFYDTFQQEDKRKTTMTKVLDDDNGFAHLWVILAIVLLAVGGAGYLVAKHDNAQKLNDSTAVQNTSNVKPLPANLDGLLSVDKVKQLAATDSPGVAVSQIGLVQTANGQVFHVQLENGSALDLDAKTGTKVQTANVGDDTEGAKIPASFTPTIDFAKAKQLAQAQITSGTIMRIELETEDGTIVYSIRFSTGSKVLVDATNGTIVKVDAANAQGKQPNSSGSSSGSPGRDSTNVNESATTSGSSSSSGSSTHTSGSSGKSTSGSSSEGSLSNSSSGSGSNSGSSSSGSGRSGSSDEGN